MLTTKLLRYRWLLFELVARDLTLRYRGSILGFAWTLLNPLLFMGVYVLVFGVYLKIGLPNYALFLLSGLLPWTWFSGAIQQGTGSILDGRMYVGKTVFPVEVLVVVPMLSQFVNYLFSLPLLLVVVALFHGHLGWPLLYLPFVILAQMMLTLAALFFTATLNVFYRDIAQLVVYGTLLLFYLIPIFYPLSRVPENLRPFVMANPFALMIMGYQQIFYENRAPGLAEIGYLLYSGFILLVIGHATFLRYKDSLGEYL